MTRIRHFVTLAAATAAFIIPGTASAAETAAPPAHLAAYNLDWLNYLAPEDLPPSRMATCIVDSGTLVTPDTPEASASGPIIERIAIDGGPGTPQGEAAEQLHGTRMAMAAVAPVNDWGTIGATTWGRAITVRAQVDGGTGFRQDAYRKGIALCQDATSRFPIAAVSLSLGCDCNVGDDELARLADAIEGAHERGLSVVASAGNRPGMPTGTPARLDGVFAAAAGSATGALCDYASFDNTTDIVGPACPVDTANPLTGGPFSDFGGGSSTATAVTASFISALRTLRPDATYQQVEAWIQDSARLIGGYRALNGEAAARLAGLGAIVDRARARMTTVAPAPTPPGSTATPIGSSPTPGPSPTPTARPGKPAVDDTDASPIKFRRFVRPRGVRVRWSDGRVVVSATNRPRAAQLQVLVEQLGEFDLAERHVRRARVAKRFSVPVRWRPDRVSVRFVARREFGPRASKPRILQRHRSGRFK